MVAFKENPVKRKNTAPPPFLRYLIILAGALFTAYFAHNWRDFVVQRQDGSYVVHPERQDEAEREKEKLEECQTYQLVARESGWYMCYLCNKGSIYLNKGEVWKYGYTCNPETRYDDDWLQQMKLQYIPLFFGDISACRQKEIELIKDYPILPENMRRPQYLRLVVPPGSKTIKMR